MLNDRKFYYDVTNKPAENPNAGQRGFGPGRRSVGPGRWNPIGPVESVVMDTSHPFPGDPTAQVAINIVWGTNAVPFVRWFRWAP